MAANFITMSKDEAIAYCYEHKKEYVNEVGQRQFDCLIDILEGDIITAADLPDYGMDF